MLRPEGGFLAGKDDYLGLYLSPANTTAQVTVEFGVWPRRSKFLECAILEYSSTDGSYSEVGSFRFRNRSFFEGAKWNPEPLPATNRAGDLEVTLLDFVSGIGNGSQRRGPDGNSHKVFSIRDGREARAMVQVEFNSPRDTNETWCMFDADLGDATGNHLGASSRSGMSSDMTFDPILWPDEPAWKLKLHLKRKNGFQPEEWVTFTNIAIPQIGTTNMLDWTNSIMGIELVLKSFVRRPDLTNRSSYSSDDLSQIRVEHPKLGESNQLDLLSIVVQPANTNLDSGGSSWSEDFHEFSLQGIPANATHLDVTFSVQPTRYVEFTVAPNWVTNDYELTGE